MLRVNLKSCLALRSMRQYQLAESVGVSESVMSNIVNGRVDPDRALRARIAEVLRADEAWLFGGILHIPPAKGAVGSGTRPDGK